MTLTEFIEARLAEDEAAAWHVHEESCGALRYTEPRQPDKDCTYPARVLREVEAKRRILAMWHDGNVYGPDRNLAMTEVVQELASVWSGHPDYDMDVLG